MVAKHRLMWLTIRCEMLLVWLLALLLVVYLIPVELLTMLRDLRLSR